MAALTLPERAFLETWSRTDFSAYNETEVREEFIIHLLHALGWRKGTTYDLEMEKALKLSAPFHRIGREQVNIDYAPSIPLERPAAEGWTPTKTLTDVAAFFEIVVRTRLEATVVAQLQKR